MAVEQPDAALYWPEITPEEGGTLDNETLVIAERRARVAAMYCSRKSMRQIAAEVPCSLGTVFNDLHAVFDGWKRLAAKSYAEHVADALLRLAEREADIEREWERSKGESTESFTGKRKRGEDTQASEERTKKTQRYGDPRLAALLVQIWDRRCRILGLLKAEDMKKLDALPPVKIVAGVNPVEAV